MWYLKPLKVQLPESKSNYSYAEFSDRPDRGKCILTNMGRCVVIDIHLLTSSSVVVLLLFLICIVLILNGTSPHQSLKELGCQ